MAGVELGGKFGGILPPHFFDELFAGLHLNVDLLAVVVVVGEGGVDAGEREMGMAADDFVDGVAQAFVPDDDVLHADVGASDSWFAAAGIGGGLDVFDRRGEGF